MVPHPARSTTLLVGLGLATLTLVAGAQTPASGVQVPPGGSLTNSFPPRPPGDPASIERGKALYGVNCAFCHGIDTRGGDSGPSLLRSSAVLDDRNGELLAPIIQSGRPDRGMPKFAFSGEQVADVAAFIHAFKAAGYDESRQRPPSIVVGDAQAGEAVFGARCASCHSPAGDLRGLATRVEDPKQLQQLWLMPGSGGRGGPVVTLKPVTATVTLASGQHIDGTVTHVDDFSISLLSEDGTRRTFQTKDESPRIELHDPLQRHRDLLLVHTDADIHNLTSFLVTLK